MGESVNAVEGDMTNREAKRSVARPTRRHGFRLYGAKPQLTPEEIAARNAAETARKIREIFSQKDPEAVSN
jgi:hypothetical protein